MSIERRCVSGYLRPGREGGGGGGTGVTANGCGIALEGDDNVWELGSGGGGSPEFVNTRHH